MNPHLGLPQSPPSSSTNQMRLLQGQVAQLSLHPSPLRQQSTFSPKTSLPNKPETLREGSLPPSNIGTPSIALKLTHSLAQMRSSRRRLLRSKPRSLTTMTTPSALTASSPTQAKSRPPSLSVRAMHAQQSGFISKTTDRWSYSQGRTIVTA